MLEGINNSGQKRLQIYAPWNGQSGTGSSISIQGTKIGDLLGGVKLPTKEQIEAGLKKVQPQNQDKITQEVQKYFEEQTRKDNEKAIRVLPYFPNLQKSEENIISLDSDLGKKISKALDSLKNRSNIIKDDLWAFADDYVPVYKPKVGLDGKIMGGPWPEYVLVGYRAKTPNEKKGVELY